MATLLMMIAARWRAHADLGLLSEGVRLLRELALASQVEGGLLSDGARVLQFFEGDAQAVRRLVDAAFAHRDLASVEVVFEVTPGAAMHVPAADDRWRAGTIDPMILEALTPSLSDPSTGPQLFRRLLLEAGAS